MANYVDMNTNNKTTNYGGNYSHAVGWSAKEVVGTIFKVIGIIVAVAATLGFALFWLCSGICFSGDVLNR